MANRDESPTEKRSVDEVLVGGGECGALMRQVDWSKTAIGPVEAWPQSLRTSVGILLASNYPLYIAWGPRYVQMYNDAYRPICGATKHPASLGEEAAVTWPEVWHMLGPGFDKILATGEANWVEDLMMPLDRNGYLEECYFTYSHSPIRDETGGVGGIFSALSETTARVLDGRRLRTLRDLSATTSTQTTPESACKAATEVLAGNIHDVPFALIYLADPSSAQARLVASSQLAPGSPAAPSLVNLTPPSPLFPSDTSPSDTSPSDAPPADALPPDVWPLGPILAGTTLQRETGIPAAWGKLPSGPWPEGASTALLLPILPPGHSAPIGVLVAGVSPRRALDDKYRDFFQLVAAGIAAGIASATARHEERQRTEALAALDREKTAFFSNVSHEFRTPLTLMLGPVEDSLGDAEEPLGPRQHERLSAVHRNGLRLLKLVNTLLDFSRLEAGRIRASYEPVDLAAFTADLCGAFRSTIERAGLTFSVDCPPLPEPAWVDREMWEKIVLNLLSNAFKFTFEGAIRVRLTGRGDHLELTVSDTGTGIPPEEISRIFERFHRIQGARGRTYEGSGIGLALVRELVALHKGTIRVESSVGAGSTFTLSVPTGNAHLPADRLDAPSTSSSTATGARAFLNDTLAWTHAPAPPPPSGASFSGAPSSGAPSSGAPSSSAPSSGAPSSSAPRPDAFHLDAPTSLADFPSTSLTISPGHGSAGHVLLVDDNADMRTYVQRLLEGRYTVETAADGDAALDAIRARLPDLVLSDVMMPGKDGFALLRELQSDTRTAMIPLILLSARAGEEATVEGLQAGASDYLVKPFSGRELLARVEGTLRTARARQDLDAFAGRIAHDLRNLLSPLLMMSAVFKLSAEGSTRRAGDRLERMTRRANNLLDGMLAFSRAEHTLDDKETSSIPVVVADVIEDLGSLRTQIAADINVDAVDDLRIAIPRGLLYVVVLNLVSNALKFMQGLPRRSVTLTARVAQGPQGPQGAQGAQGTPAFAELRVADTGPGIAPDVIRHIFEPFYRAPGERASGHGIGLATVQRIVQSCGGHITVQSTPGKGTTFQITLPLDRDAS
ncbi:ATP-binding protein [Chondromyces apiculatus]|uniref:histidine kinase n=1 Tax=Chondromyces apiculatus DSM 436 TaxID=1192034 RepID=A0A017T4X4_9BACT|nr:ATP-binding protein [Chondromyces apiculatus]EYF04289.1 Chemotaxis protein methyltransferase CheR [Chondromyces apiculatus DSM 436]